MYNGNPSNKNAVSLDAQTRNSFYVKFDL